MNGKPLQSGHLQALSAERALDVLDGETVQQRKIQVVRLRNELEARSCQIPSCSAWHR